jgi:hypothetical protein
MTYRGTLASFGRNYLVIGLAMQVRVPCIGSRLRSRVYWLVLSSSASGFGSSPEGGLAESGEVDLDAILWPR